MPVPISNLSAIFANSQQTFVGLGLNVSYTAAATGSRLFELKVNNEPKFWIGLNGIPSTNLSSVDSVARTLAQDAYDLAVAVDGAAVGAGANAFASATIAGANTAVGAGANAYYSNVYSTIAGANTAVGAGANNFFLATIAGANTAVGAGANAYYSNVYSTIAGANAYYSNVYSTIAGANAYYSNVYSTIAGANTAVGAGANAYYSNVYSTIAGANAYYSNVYSTIAGANTAVGTGANNFLLATIAGANTAVGAGANAYYSNVYSTIAGANTAVGAGANNFLLAVIAGANTAVGAGANAFASATIAGANTAVGAGANNFLLAVIAGANTAVGTGANNYQIAIQNGANTAVGAGANAFTSATIAGANTAVGAGANAFTSATIAGANTAVGAGANTISIAAFSRANTPNIYLANSNITSSVTIQSSNPNILNFFADRSNTGIDVYFDSYSGAGSIPTSNIYIRNADVLLANVSIVSSPAATTYTIDSTIIKRPYARFLMILNGYAQGTGTTSWGLQISTNGGTTSDLRSLTTSLNGTANVSYSRFFINDAGEYAGGASGTANSYKKHFVLYSVSSDATNTTFYSFYNIVGPFTANYINWLRIYTSPAYNITGGTITLIGYHV